MANVISYENFDQTRIVLNLNKKNLYAHPKYGWKKIFPRYIYPNGVEDGIFIQIPPVYSFGVYSFDPVDKKADAGPSHSLSFVLKVNPTQENGLDDKTADEMSKGLLNIFDTILQLIKSFLQEDDTIRKLEKMNNKEMWLALAKTIKPLYNYQKDKDTASVIEGAPPTMFAKLKVSKGVIKTNFQQIIQDPEDKNANIIVNIDPSELPHKFQGAKCNLMGIIHVESIFVSQSNVVSIQYKVNQVLVIEVLTERINRLVLPEYLLKKKPVENVLESVYAEEEEDEGPSPIEAPRRIVRRKQ